MSQLLRFILILVAGLALLAIGATRVVQRTTQKWFESDIALRAQLAVTGARSSLVHDWESNFDGVQHVLADLARDERIMGAAACGIDRDAQVWTENYPNTEFSCRELIRRLDPTGEASPETWEITSFFSALPGGRVHVNVIPIRENEKTLGVVALVHDVNFMDRRDAKLRQLILIAFAVLAISTSLITVIAGRMFWRGWTRQIQRFIRGEGLRREFQPILQDVRELIEHVASERAQEDQGGGWTPQRLRRALTEHLHGERIVVLANREPYIHNRDEEGNIRTLHPASGLVTALEPVMRACGGVWVAHGSGSADRETVDARSRVRVPPGEESYVLRRVWLTPEEEKGYYYGFANEGLWPLCHIAHTRPSFRREDWNHYKEVNRRFADAVCEEVDSDDPVILVQDYHYACAPRMIRERLPRATIITFWHIPWPNSERFGICPWSNELMNGLLGSSILGFHTRLHCNNFLDSVDRFMEARIDREQLAVVQRGRSTLIRPYPISIEWPNHWAQSAPPVAECRASVFKDLNLKADALLGVGVDRLDYTKGIEERLWAVQRLLELHPEYRERFTFVQLAAPSRTLIERYQQLNDSVERIAAQVNEQFGTATYKPIVLLRAHHEPPTVFRFLRAADVCYVSSLHDGMNLVAKEFVAARDDENGVLVLSHFAGASRELSEALIVNPYDLDEASAALDTALRMPPEERQARMRSMRSLLSQFNVYRWAGRMLIDAARLRWKDRLSGRLSSQNGSSRLS
jgi:trehalose 6-phosphate synthase